MAFTFEIIYEYLLDLEIVRASIWPIYSEGCLVHLVRCDGMHATLWHCYESNSASSHAKYSPAFIAFIVNSLANGIGEDFAYYGKKPAPIRAIVYEGWLDKMKSY